MTLEQLQVHLRTYLAHHGRAPRGGSPGPLVPLTGGWASSLYTFTLPHAESGEASATLVLKAYAPDTRGREHAAREWRALTHLRAAGHPVPRVVLLELDPRHLGRPFLVMEHLPGASLWAAYEASDAAARGDLTRSFVARLVALHAADPRLLEPATDLARPQAHIDRELEQLRRDSADAPHDGLAEAVRWLEQRRDAGLCQRPVILHRDYHPWNVLVDDAGAGGVHLWVLDWDWQVGDARFDLAWTYTLMQRSGHDAFADAVREEYARQSERPLVDLAYFEVLATLRWLLNVLPALEPDAPMDATARADFAAFLVEPVQRAQALLRQRTGIAVNIGR